MSFSDWFLLFIVYVIKILIIHVVMQHSLVFVVISYLYVEIISIHVIGW